MAKSELVFGEIGNGGTKLLAYGKNGGQSTGINEHGHDSSYCNVSSDYKTITFIKPCSGIIGFNNDYGSFTGTLQTTKITGASSYTEELWSFTANAGDTITFSSNNWWGYEIIGS